MPVIDIITDPETLTITVIAEFDAAPRRVWDAYLDPRRLERFWGPPTHPATFTRHDGFVGGLSSYFMTSPEGERFGGTWEWLAVDAPVAFEVLDGFASPDGTPDRDLPVGRMRIEFEATTAGTRTTTTTRYETLEGLEQVLEMGMVEGLRLAMGQIDDVLADLRAFVAEQATAAQVLSDTRIRVSRVIRGTPEQVWAAHEDAGLMQQWLLGPDGWTMPVCEVATAVGEQFRYEWAAADGSDRFGFTGELLERREPWRMVTTESMIGMPGEPSVNEMTLTPVADGTLLSLVITYPSQEVRDLVLGTGMTDGMESSYARLEALL